MPQKVVNVLLKELPKNEAWNLDIIQYFDMRLANVARSIKKEGNWLEVEGLFKALLMKIQKYDSMKQKIILSHFYQIVCCTQNGNIILIHRLWKLYLTETNKIIIAEGEPKSADWASFCGMLHGAILVLPEDELISFIREFLSFRRQGIAVYDVTIQIAETQVLDTDILCVKEKQEQSLSEIRLPEQVLNERCCLMLIFLEYRFREKWPDTESIAKLVVNLKTFGDRVLDNRENPVIQKMLSYCTEDYEEENAFKNIVRDLFHDRENNQNKCCVNILASVLTKK